jgi:predicted anti-sigma-YlaC factor YlaD
MNDNACELVRMSAQALSDGEKPPLTSAQIAEHCQQCAGCLREVAELERLCSRLSGTERQEYTAELWPAIAQSLEVTPASETSTATPLLILAATIAIATEVFVLIAAAGIGFRLIPIVAACVLFAGMRENPFKLNPAVR